MMGHRKGVILMGGWILAFTFVLAVASPQTLRAQDAPAVEVRRELFSLGGVGAAPDEEFFQVRSPFLLPDGRLVVPDAGSSQVRIFDSAGELLVSAGRDGDGPGEYRAIERVFPYRGDSLAVFDSQSQRVTVLDADGTPARTLPLGDAGVAKSGTLPGGRTPVRAFVAGVFADGSFLLRRGEISVGTGDTTSVRRDRFRYSRVDPTGRLLAHIISLPDDEQFVWAEGGSRSVRPRAFGRTTAVAVHGDRIFVADNTGFGITILDQAGDTVATAHAPRSPRSIDEDDREGWIEAEVGKLQGRRLRAVAEKAVRAMNFPEAMPYHGDLVVGTDGRTWLEEYRPPHSDEAPVWTVFDTDGRLIGRYLFPRGFRLSWADRTRALGVRLDELDVETVVAYRLPDA